MRPTKFTLLTATLAATMVAPSMGLVGVAAALGNDTQVRYLLPVFLLHTVSTSKTNSHPPPTGTLRPNLRRPPPPRPHSPPRLVHSNTAQGPVNTGPMWTMQGAVFRAWASQQPATVPLYRLGTPSLSDYIFELGTIDPQTEAPIPPTVNGYNTNIGLTAWVYDTFTCGSVPLFGAAYALLSDHFYTTDADEHAGLIANGWTDAGVVGYVLPV